MCIRDRQKCFHLNQKNIPLLDAIIDGEFQNQPAHSHDEIKSIIHKASEFIKPYPVVTLGSCLLYTSRCV